MKLYKRMKYQYYGIAIPPVIIAAIVLLNWGEAAVATLKLGTIYSLTLLILLFTPARKITLQTCKGGVSLKFFPWLLAVFGILLLYMIFYFATLVLLTAVVPVPTLTPAKLALTDVQQILPPLIWLQPYSLLALVTIALAYNTYNRKQPAIIYYCFQLLFGSATDSVPGHTVYYFVENSEKFLFSWSVSIATFLIAFGIMKLVGIPLTTGLSLPTLTLAPLLLLPFTNKYCAAVIRFLDYRTIPLVVYIVISMIIQIAIICVFSVAIHFAYQYASQYLPSNQINVQEFNSKNVSLTLFSFAWWLCFIPLVSSLLTRISANRSIIALLFVVGILPTMLVFVGLHPTVQLLIAKVLTADYAAHYSIIISIIMFMLFLLLNCFFHDITPYVSGLMPNTLQERFATPTRFMRFYLILASIVTGAYLLNGIYYIHIMAFLIAFPVLFVYIFLAAMVVYTFIKAGRAHAITTAG